MLVCASQAASNTLKLSGGIIWSVAGGWQAMQGGGIDRTEVQQVSSIAPSQAWERRMSLSETFHRNPAGEKPVR